MQTLETKPQFQPKLHWSQRRYQTQQTQVRPLPPRPQPEVKKTRTITVVTSCPECCGFGFVPHHHVTNKRNKKKCPVCPTSLHPNRGTGEVTKQIEVPIR